MGVVQIQPKAVATPGAVGIVYNLTIAEGTARVMVELTAAELKKIVYRLLIDHPITGLGQAAVKAWVASIK